MMEKEFKDELTKALEVLKSGGVILYPTDTVWGIGCDATNEEAVQRIYKIKKREDSKSMIVLMDNPNKLLSYIDQVPDQAWQLIEYSDKPLSIVLDGAKNLAASAISEDGSIAVRITKDEFCKSLLGRFRKPIISTSANISGEKTPGNYHEIQDSILSSVDYIVNLRHFENTLHKPSTIIRLRKNGQIEFIRK